VKRNFECCNKGLLACDEHIVMWSKRITLWGADNEYDQKYIFDVGLAKEGKAQCLE